MKEEQRFEKVVENEYEIDLVLEIGLPLFSVIFGFLFGYFMMIQNIIGSYITGLGLAVIGIVYLIGVGVYLEGRKVYWRKIK